MNGQTGRWGEMHRWRGEGEPVPPLLSSCTPCRCTPPQRQRLWCLGRGEVIPLLRHPIVPRPDLFVPPHRAIMRNPSPRLTSGRTGEDITSHFHHGTSRLSRKQRGEQAGQAESLPAAGCSNAPLPSCMAWMASGNNAYLLLRLHQLARLFLHHFSLQLMVAQAGPDRRRELPRSCLTAPLASIKPRLSTPPSLLPQILLDSRHDITFPRKTDLFGFDHSHSRLASIRGRAGGGVV